MVKVASLALLALAQASASKTEGNRAIIVGGQEAPVGRYPWMVGLRSSTNGSPFCGGTLVSPTVVYTAAHCGSANVVSIGCHNVNDSCEKISVSSNLINPSYVSSPVPLRDYNLQFLSSAASSPTIPFVGDSSYLLGTGDDITVIGYGTTSAGGSVSSFLREVEVDVVSQSTCSSNYASQGLSIDSASMFCASRSGKDSCQGDSGGPIFYRCDNTEEDVLVGLVSWGIGCAQANFPGVYASVSGGDSFLKSNVAGLATPPPVDDPCGPVGPTSPPVPTVPAPVPAPTSPPTPTCIFFC